MNNNAYIVMNNDVYLVVDNPNTNAITTAGTGGNIISENESNIIKWNIGTTTGIYYIPFTKFGGIKIPIYIDVATAGTGSGNIQCSTFGGPNWDNYIYKPTGVTNMSNMAVLNNSSEVIDRFWIIDAQGYATKPGGSMKFNYDDAEHLATGNTITETDLKAERYDEPMDTWELFPLGGVVNTTSNYIEGIPFNSLDFTRIWTLIDQTTHLLPIELTSFTVECVLNNAVISWQTAQEINTNYFILEMSYDGIKYDKLTVIDAAGNSTSQTDYSFISENNVHAYFKLTLVDINGEKEMLGVVSEQCGKPTSQIIHAFSSDFHQITIQLLGLDVGDYKIQLFDLSSKLFFEQTIFIDQFYSQYILNDERLLSGIYIIHLSALNSEETKVYSQKILIVN